MKKISKIIIWIVVIFAVIFLLLHIAVALFGKTIVTGQIEKNLKLRTTLESLNVSFPLSVNIRKLDIQGLARIDSLSARPSILGFLAGKIVLNELKVVRPQITLLMDQEGKLNLPQFDSAAKQPPILLAGLNIQEGSLVFIDKNIDPSGYKTMVNNINVHISKVAFPPTSLYAKFNVSVFLGESKEKSKGNILASGWIDFGPKDMEGKVTLKDIDVTYLAPYYQKFDEVKKLVAGKLNFVSDLQAKNNTLLAKCHLELSDLVYAKESPTEGQSQAGDLMPGILTLFSDSSGKMVFDFAIHTKLDNPRIDLKNLRSIMAQSAVENIANQPPEKIIENIKDAGKQFKDLGKSLKEMFKKKE